MAMGSRRASTTSPSTVISQGRELSASRLGSVHLWSNWRMPKAALTSFALLPPVLGAVPKCVHRSAMAMCGVVDLSLRKLTCPSA